MALTSDGRGAEGAAGKQSSDPPARIPACRAGGGRRPAAGGLAILGTLPLYFCLTQAGVTRVISPDDGCPTQARSPSPLTCREVISRARIGRSRLIKGPQDQSWGHAGHQGFLGVAWDPFAPTLDPRDPIKTQYATAPREVRLQRDTEVARAGGQD